MPEDELPPKAGQDDGADRGDDDGDDDRDQGAKRKDKPAPESRAADKEKPSGPGFFTIYKKGQGYWTRMGTVAGVGFVGALVAYNIYAYAPYMNMAPRVAIGVAAAFFLVYALL